MKTPSLLAAGLLLLTSSLLAQTNQPAVLVDEAFNLPIGFTGSFPPDPGTEYLKFSPQFSAWASKNAQITVTYAAGLGTNGSGGLTCKVAKPYEHGGFMFLSCNKVKLPVPSADRIASTVKGLTVEFSIKAPEGSRLSHHIIPEATSIPEDLKARSWESRLVAATIVGTGKYEKMTIKFADLPAEVVAPLTLLLTDCYNKGMTEIAVDFVWQIIGEDWVEGKEFSIDDVKITSTP